MTWVLFLWMWSGGHRVSLTVVDGFDSYDRCFYAGNLAETRMSDIEFDCVPKGKTP